MKTNFTSWGKVAEWYDDLLEKDDDSYQAKVIFPNLVRLLDIKKGEKILDLGCGQGFFSRVFEKGGAEVIGADISEELIKIAKEKSASPLLEANSGESKKKISYIVTSSDDLSKIENNSIDTITIILALQNIEKMNETLAECKRVLKKEGRVFIVLNHPAFRIPGKSAWAYDEQKDVQYRRIDAYISESKEEIVMFPSKQDSPKTISFHRPIQSYVKALSKSGFAVTRLEEWNSHKVSEKGKREKSENRARKEIPMFLMLESRPL